jgi:hypothetical protein
LKKISFNGEIIGKKKRPERFKWESRKREAGIVAALMGNQLLF